VPAKRKKAAKKNTTADLPNMDGPGVAQPSILEIDEAADKYVAIRDKRCQISPKEIAAKAELIDAIHAHADQLARTPEGAIIYRYGEEVVILTPGKENVKVKKAGSADEE
jgi:hypothetical protein